MTWLITGGAGYIGSHVVRALHLAGHRIVVVDDMSSGNVARLDPETPYHHVSVHDTHRLRRVIAQHGVTGIIHLAARKHAAESCSDPLLYYRENVGGLVGLLESAVDGGVGHVVFSSSVSVYGDPADGTVREGDPCAPTTPFGRTKLVGEQMVQDVAAAHGLRAVSLRYVNVAGSADPALADRRPGNLVPTVMQRLAAGHAPQIHGTGFGTADGTCERDYVDVRDVATAHVLAATWLMSDDHGEGAPTAFNVGRGEAVSVRQLVRQAQLASGRTELAPEELPARPGTPARRVADVSLIRQHLGWTARHTVAEMMSTSWAGWVPARTAARV